MKIKAIFWQPQERLLTVQTADLGYTQLGGTLSPEELVDRLGEELAKRICEPSCHDETLSDQVVHALRGDGLGYLNTRYSDGHTVVVPTAKDAAGNTMPARDLDADDADTSARPRF